MNINKKSKRRIPIFRFFYDVSDRYNVVKQPFTIPSYTMLRRQKKMERYLPSSSEEDDHVLVPIPLVSSAPKGDSPQLGDIDKSDIILESYEIYHGDPENQIPEEDLNLYGSLFSSDFDPPSNLLDEIE